jgi:hypothetical protein
MQTVSSYERYICKIHWCSVSECKYAMVVSEFSHCCLTTKYEEIIWRVLCVSVESVGLSASSRNTTERKVSYILRNV